MRSFCFFSPLSFSQAQAATSGSRKCAEGEAQVVESENSHLATSEAGSQETWSLANRGSRLPLKNLFVFRSLQIPHVPSQTKRSRVRSRLHIFT